MLAEFPDVRLVAVTDPDVNRSGAFAARHGVRAVPNLEELLDTGMDAVYVCVPPFAHGPAELAIVAAGVAMFVEKPLGLDCAVADRVAAAVSASGVVTAVGHHWRYSAAVPRAVRLLAGRPVRLAIGTWLDKVPPVDWWVHRGHSGGQVIEQAVHVLDLARMLIGEVAEVCALADGEPPAGFPDADVDGATAAVLRFERGSVGTLAATCQLDWKHRAGLEVYADGIVIALTEDRLQAWNRRGEVQSHTVDPDEAKRAADRAFIDAVLGAGDDIRAPYHEALRTHRVACAIARSAVDGCAQRIKEGTHATN
jgi:myo-inositol 2-dehydrogenase / D-chiro-inositol 1-dehydrogenase